jgi:carboxypeptidase Q
VLAAESDFGTDRIYAVALPPAVAHAPFADTLMRLLGPIGILSATRTPVEFGTDVGPSIAAGVPGFALDQDGTRYFDIHHTADDTLDKVDRAQLDQNVAAWAALVWLAADSDVNFRGPGTPPPPPAP